MNRMRALRVAGLLGSGLLGCTHTETAPPDRVVARTGPVELPGPYATDSVRKFSKVLGWPEDKAPSAPRASTVTRFADGTGQPALPLHPPQWGRAGGRGQHRAPRREEARGEADRVRPSEHIEQSANRITLLRDADRDGVPEMRTELPRGSSTSPSACWCSADCFYVANTDGVWRYPYQTGGDRPHRQGREAARPARGRLQQPLDAQPAGQRRRHEDLRVGGLGQQRGGARPRERGAPRQHPGDQPGRLGRARLRQRPAQPRGHGLGAGDARAVDRGERARRAGRGPGARLPHPRGGGRLLRLAPQPTSAPTWIRA